jgi:hypothetical protein
MHYGGHCQGKQKPGNTICFMLAIEYNFMHKIVLKLQNYMPEFDDVRQMRPVFEHPN